MTHQEVYDIILNSVESDAPDAVLEALRPFDGKMITTRLLDKLPGGKAEWSLERQYGMTHLKNKTYRMSQGSEKGGISLLLGHSEASFPLDVAKVEKDNAAYFSARKERNHARMEARNTKAALDAMAALMSRVKNAIATLESAEKEFERLAGYGTTFYPDRYTLERECRFNLYRDGKRAMRRQNP